MPSEIRFERHSPRVRNTTRSPRRDTRMYRKMENGARDICQSRHAPMEQAVDVRRVINKQLSDYKFPLSSSLTLSEIIANLTSHRVARRLSCKCALSNECRRTFQFA